MANGIYTNSELVKSLVADLNALVKNELCGEYVMACAIVTGMAQKLMNLQKTIDNDLKNRDETIEMLKERLRACGQEVIEVPADEYMKETDNGK
jgi:hypothetical protein